MEINEVLNYKKTPDELEIESLIKNAVPNIEFLGDKISQERENQLYNNMKEINNGKIIHSDIFDYSISKNSINFKIYNFKNNLLSMMLISISENNLIVLTIDLSEITIKQLITILDNIAKIFKCKAIIIKKEIHKKFGIFDIYKNIKCFYENIFILQENIDFSENVKKYTYTWLFDCIKNDILNKDLLEKDLKRLYNLYESLTKNKNNILEVMIHMNGKSVIIFDDDILELKIRYENIIKNDINIIDTINWLNPILLPVKIFLITENEKKCIYNGISHMIYTFTSIIKGNNLIKIFL
jgi:hypothetical protein